MDFVAFDRELDFVRRSSEAKKNCTQGALNRPENVSDICFPNSPRFILEFRQIKDVMRKSKDSNSFAAQEVRRQREIITSLQSDLDDRSS